MKRIEKIYVLIVLIIMPTFLIIGKESRENEKVKQIKVGNFALPGEQQPSPLLSFGQDIIDKGITQIFGFVDQLKGSKTNFIEVRPSLLYGITDYLSVFIELPIAVHFKDENFSSHGPQDFLLQFEGLIYSRETSTLFDMITGVANIMVPTGSATQNPPTGFGSPSFFLGFTINRTKTDWYYFTSEAALLTTAHKDIKFGNQFLYQFGLGRNIAYRPDKWIFNWLVELNGTYSQRDKTCGVVDCNSGGNTILFGPSLWFSTRHLILQLGVSGVVSQHLFGTQSHDNYLIAADIGWTF